MKLFRKIDTETGNFLEDVLFESHPTLEDGELDPQYIEDAPSQGFYWPKWNGTEWVEGGVAPEQTEPEPQVPTIEEVAIALMNMQAELKATTEALDFLIMGGRKNGRS